MSLGENFGSAARQGQVGFCLHPCPHLLAFWWSGRKGQTPDAKRQAWSGGEGEGMVLWAQDPEALGWG